MKLERFSIIGSESYRTLQSVNLDSHLTVLAGRNNVGKSALMRAMSNKIEPTHNSTGDLCIEYIWSMTNSELLAQIKSINESISIPEVWNASQSITFKYTIGNIKPSATYPTNTTSTPNVGYVNVNGTTNPSITSFTIELEEPKIISARLFNANGQVQLMLDENSSDFINQDFSLDRTLISSNFTDNSNITARLNFASAIYQTANNLCSKIYYISPRRQGAVTAPFLVANSLSNDGSNLTTVVATLYANNHILFSKMETLIKRAFPGVIRIGVQMISSTLAEGISTSPNTRIRIVYDDNIDFSVPLEMCGTGIEQMMIIATAILTSQKSSLILIDEPHSYLHPLAEKYLLDFINEYPEIQFVVATHSAVFLNSIPLSKTRLIVIDGGGSHISDVGNKSQILEAVGITAADLWLAEAIFWVEGKSDVEIIQTILEHDSDLKGTHISVRSMPDWIRSSSGSSNKLNNMIDFCQTILESIIPLNIPTIFLFDGDEKSVDFRQRIENASSQKARFLEKREIENYFLSPQAIFIRLSEILLALELDVPEFTEADVENELQRLLEDISDQEIYKQAVDASDPSKAAGYSILRKLWWKYISSEYDKIKDGRELARLICEKNINEFSFLVNILRNLSMSVQKT